MEVNPRDKRKLRLEIMRERYARSLTSKDQLETLLQHNTIVQQRIHMYLEHKRKSMQTLGK